MRVKKETSAGGIVFKVLKNKIFVAVIHRMKQNDWTLPKGHVEEGEDLESTAIREVKEETNNKVVILDKVDSFTYLVEDKEKNIKYERTVYWFLMESKEDNSKTLNFEIDEVKWVSIDGDFSFMTYNNDKAILEKGILLINSLSRTNPA